MSRPGVSLIVYSIYLGSSGAALALVPNLVFPLLGLQGADQVWPRVFGFLALVLAVKGSYGAILNNMGSMQLDTITRTCFATFLTILVIAGISPRVMIIFAILDYIGAAWTQITLNQVRKATAAPSARPATA